MNTVNMSLYLLFTRHTICFRESRKGSLVCPFFQKLQPNVAFNIPGLGKYISEQILSISEQILSDVKLSIAPTHFHFAASNQKHYKRQDNKER